MLSYKMYKWCCIVLVIYGGLIGNHKYILELLSWFSFGFWFMRGWKELFPMFIKHYDSAP